MRLPTGTYGSFLLLCHCLAEKWAIGEDALSPSFDSCFVVRTHYCVPHRFVASLSLVCVFRSSCAGYFGGGLLTGPIPGEIGTASSLEILDCQKNMLSGWCELALVYRRAENFATRACPGQSRASCFLAMCGSFPSQLSIAISCDDVLLPSPPAACNLHVCRFWRMEAALLGAVGSIERRIAGVVIAVRPARSLGFFVA